MFIAGVLEAKDGFIKYIQVDYPPSQEYHIPVYDKASWKHWKDGEIAPKSHFGNRIFMLDRIENNVVFYREV